MKSHFDVILSRNPSLKSSPVILLCGISGSGKTWLARMLENEGYKRLSVDRYISDTHGAEFQSYSKEKQFQLTADAEKQIAQSAYESAIRGDKVVVDACLCKRAKRDIVREIVCRSGKRPLLVHLKANFQTSLRRLETRTGNGCDDICISPEMLSRFFEGFQPPDEDENAIVIDTTE